MPRNIVCFWLAAGFDRRSEGVAPRVYEAPRWDDDLLLLSSPREGGPLDLVALITLQAADSGKARTWLLPLLKQHTQNASLDFWATHLLPVARLMVQKAAVLPGVGPQALLALQLRALEAQIWATLPSFCQWPVDTADAFRSAPPRLCIASASLAG